MSRPLKQKVNALLDRRSFVNLLLIGAAGQMCLPKPGLAASTIEKRKLTKVGAQLYTVRKELERDFKGTLARIAALGFREVEFAGYFNHSPEQIKNILAGNNLSAPSAHVQTSVLRGSLEGTIEAARIIGHQYLICAYLPAEERRSLDDYRKLIDLLNRVGEQFKRAGIQFGYHNHDFEFAPMEGRIPYDLILAGTDAQLVKMEMDLYWITKAGYSPLAYFQKYPGRFPIVHIKDMDNTPGHFFTEVGRGIIDFRPILAAAKQAGIQHYFIEQDETPGSPFESLKISLDYLKRLEF